MRAGGHSKSRSTSRRASVFVCNVRCIGNVTHRLSRLRVSQSPIQSCRPDPSLASVAINWRCRAVTAKLAIRRLALPTRADDCVGITGRSHSSALPAAYPCSPSMVANRVATLNGHVALPADAGVFTGHDFHLFVVLLVLVVLKNSSPFRASPTRFQPTLSALRCKPRQRSGRKRHCLFARNTNGSNRRPAGALRQCAYRNHPDYRW
jgi:hypothetical protein